MEDWDTRLPFYMGKEMVGELPHIYWSKSALQKAPISTLRVQSSKFSGGVCAQTASYHPYGYKHLSPPPHPFTELFSSSSFAYT